MNHLAVFALPYYLVREFAEIFSGHEFDTCRAGFLVQKRCNSGCWMRDSGCWALDAGIWMADDFIAERFGEPSDVTVVPFVDREDGIGFRGGGFSLHRNCGGRWAGEMPARW